MKKTTQKIDQRQHATTATRQPINSDRVGNLLAPYENKKKKPLKKTRDSAKQCSFKVRL